MATGAFRSTQAPSADGIVTDHLKLATARGEPGEADVFTYIAKLRGKPKGGQRLSFAAIASPLDAEDVATRERAAVGGKTVRGIAVRSR